jgi:apolipoprotein N-acyltransferase
MRRRPSLAWTIFHIVFGLATAGLWWITLAIHRFQRRGVRASVIWTLFHLVMGILTCSISWIGLAIYRFQGR